MVVPKNTINSNLANNIKRTEVVGFSESTINTAVQSDTDLQLLGMASMVNELMLESEAVKNDQNMMV